MAELNEKENAQLGDEELEGVSGGNGMFGGIIPKQSYRCRVTGAYWGNSELTTPPNYSAIGMTKWVYYDPSLPGYGKYVLTEYNGFPIGWTITENFQIY